MGARTCKNVCATCRYYIPTELTFCIPPLVVGFVLPPVMDGRKPSLAREGGKAKFKGKRKHFSSSILIKYLCLCIDHCGLMLEELFFDTSVYC